MSTATMSTRDEFLDDCDKEDRAAYEKLFADFDALAEELGDPNPADASGLDAPLDGQPLRLRLSIEKKGAVLRFRHDKLKESAALLWFFPSKGEKRWSGVGKITTQMAPMAKVGIRPEDAAKFGVDLQSINFVSGGTKALKTSTAGEIDGVSRIFRWDRNRSDLIAAIRKLIERVNAY